MRRANIISSIDWVTVFLYLMLITFGWFTIYSADYSGGTESIWSQSTQYGAQLKWIMVSIFVGSLFILIDSKIFIALAYPVYILILTLLVAVIFIGTEVKGATSWFSIGGFKIQPSEFAKFAVCLAIAKYLSALNVDARKIQNQMVALALAFIPALLIVVQGDAGTALVYSGLLLVLYREGMAPTILILGVALVILSILSLVLDNFLLAIGIGIVGAVSMILMRKNRPAMMAIGAAAAICIVLNFGIGTIYNKVLEPHQKARISGWLQIDDTPIPFNVDQSLIAIGSGGFTGKGYLQGTQNKFGWVPEISTDFIFSTVGEELGFIGCFVLIGLFLALMLRIIALADRQRSKFSRVYGYGIVSIIMIHFLINIGMTIGLIPVIGIPLPFISYGGSSLLAFTILLFLFIKLDAERLMVLR